MTKTDLADVARGPEDQGRSAQKRRAILDAATNVFLEKGYLGASMDEIAALAPVSKQTVYKQFSTKEALFVEIVRSTTNQASDKVHNEMPNFGAGEDPAEYLRTYAYRQLTVVLQPRIMQLRRLVIGEVGRFPELAKALFVGGPKRAISALGAALRELADRGHLVIDDPNLAASQFNWLIMGEPLNRVMLLGDDAVPTPAELRRHAADSVRMFLAAYGMEGNRTSRRRDRRG
jgi:TetR/AcrR family transcriptional regulator, mexJK operon transcriptional repressor